MAFRYGSSVTKALRSAWRHWGCVTPKIIENLKKKHEVASDIDGFEEISEEDQRRVEKAYDDGHVADEDIPESARKPDGDEKDKVEATKKTTTKKRTRVSFDLFTMCISDARAE